MVFRGSPQSANRSLKTLQTNDSVWQAKESCPEQETLIATQWIPNYTNLSDPTNNNFVHH